MKNTRLVAGLCLGLAAFSSQAGAVTATPLPTASLTPPSVTQVWWPGPATVCRRGYYGSLWCRPARPLGWIPGHYSWGGHWIPGHWA